MPHGSLVALNIIIPLLPFIALILPEFRADDGLIKKGYHVGIVGVELNESKCFVINKEQGYLILEPDTLISVTSVVSTYFCDRKTIFNERMRLPLNNRSILEGLIGHEMLGRVHYINPCFEIFSKVILDLGKFNSNFSLFVYRGWC